MPGPSVRLAAFTPAPDPSVLLWKTGTTAPRCVSPLVVASIACTRTLLVAAATQTQRFTLDARHLGGLICFCFSRWLSRAYVFRCQRGLVPPGH